MLPWENMKIQNLKYSLYWTHTTFASPSSWKILIWTIVSSVLSVLEVTQQRLPKHFYGLLKCKVLSVPVTAACLCPSLNGIGFLPPDVTAWVCGAFWEVFRIRGGLAGVALLSTISHKKFASPLCSLQCGGNMRS